MTHIFESIIAKISVKHIVMWIVLLLVMGCSVIVMYRHSLPDGKTLTVIFCNVGQGDAIYLQFPDGRDMLIDGGPDGSVLSCLSKFKPFWDRSIDILLYTHPDLDHFGGLLSVIRRYSIGVVLRTHAANTSVEYRNFRELITQNHIQEHFMVAGDSIEISGVLLSWVWPTKEVDRNNPSEDVLIGNGDVTEVKLNDFSQVIHLRYGNFDVLLTGDAGISVAQFYQDQIHISDPIDILKVPHHGSLDSLNEHYITRIRPIYAVISAGKKNRYKHPRLEILELLQKHNILIFSTAKQGNLVFTTDGIHCTVPPVDTEKQ